MSQRNPNFWTDYIQASERIANTVVLYDKDPFYVTQCYQDASPMAAGTLYTDKGASSAHFKLSDPKFHRFRKLPATGWVNSYNYKRAFNVDRVPVRTRQHGFSDQNVTLATIYDNSRVQNGDERMLRFCSDKGYIEACHGVYPSLRDILENIRQESSLAFSSKYAVYRDDKGIRWLFRGVNKIGLFFGADTLMLLSDSTCYKEELQSDPLVSISNIREF